MKKLHDHTLEERRVEYRKYLGEALDALTAARGWCPYPWRRDEIQQKWKSIHDLFLNDPSDYKQAPNIRKVKPTQEEP